MRDMILKKPPVNMNQLEVGYLITFLFTAQGLDIPASLDVTHTYQLLNLHGASQFQKSVLSFFIDYRDEVEYTPSIRQGLTMIFVLDFEWHDLPSDFADCI